MRYAITIFFLFTLFTACREQSKEPATENKPVPASKYSASFNQAINELLDDYYNLSESLVKWDTTGANTQAAALINKLDSSRFTGLKDTLVHQTAVSYVKPLRNDLQTIINHSDITEKRKTFNSMTQNFYDLLRAIKYDAATIYLEECTMPYNDTGSGLWLSRTNISDSIRNPYLGLYHPRYGKGMLTCSSVKDSVNFMTSK